MIPFNVEIPLPKWQCVKLEYHALACQYVLESVLSRGIPGDVAEFGVNEGDNFVPMARLLQERLTEDGRKNIFAFDCFEGLPWGEDNPDGESLQKGECHCPFPRFREICQNHGVWRDAIMVPGLVEDTAGGILGIHDYGHPKIPGPEKICNELERGELHPGKWRRFGPIVGNACFFERLSD
jgi:hypothetical protein